MEEGTFREVVDQFIITDIRVKDCIVDTFKKQGFDVDIKPIPKYHCCEFEITLYRKF